MFGGESRDAMVSHSDGVAAERLVRVLETASITSVGDLPVEVRGALSAYVDELKRQELRPERALVSVKQVLARVSGSRGDEDQRLFHQRAISCCITAYYRTE